MLTLACLWCCWSQVGSVCAFFHLIRLYDETSIFFHDSAAEEKLKNEADDLFVRTVKPMLPRLLHSLDPAITDAATGNNALHELLSRLTPASTEVWLYRLTEALIQHGVDIHQRNKQGRTVALCHAHMLRSQHKYACTLHSLLRHGADINAQDSNGDTLLHYFIRNQAVDVLRELLDVGASGLDLFVLNNAGHAPADLAAIKHAEKPDDNKRSQIHRIIRAQVQVWRSRIRPAVLSALGEPLIPDLAKLVLGYVDGSGLAFSSAATKVEPPAAPAAAAFSN